MTLTQVIDVLLAFKIDLFDDLAEKNQGTAEELRLVAERASGLILKAVSALRLRPQNASAIKATHKQVKKAINDILKSFGDIGVDTNDLPIVENKIKIRLQNLLAEVDAVFKPMPVPSPQANEEEKRKAAAAASESFRAQADRISRNRQAFLSSGLTFELLHRYEEKAPIDHYEQIKQALSAKEGASQKAPFYQSALNYVGSLWKRKRERLVNDLSILAGYQEERAPLSNYEQIKQILRAKEEGRLAIVIDAKSTHAIAAPEQLLLPPTPRVQSSSSAHADAKVLKKLSPVTSEQQQGYANLIAQAKERQAKARADAAAKAQPQARVALPKTFTH